MQKIVPHLWFDTEAVAATEFYTTVFSDAKITHKSVVKDTPSGDCDVVGFQIMGYDFMAISAGPFFKINPSISFSLNLETKAEVQAIWDKLVDGGTVLMELQPYPFSEFYGWLNDKYGVSWQLIALGEQAAGRPRVTPAFMFTQARAGQAEAAVNFYTSVFKDSRIEGMFRYGPDQAPDQEGTVAHSVFYLAGQEFMALDSARRHEFGFTEAVSLMVNCADQTEIDYYWQKLSAVPAAEQCGWLKDKYGVSWQIVPVNMNELIAANPSKTTPVMLQMKKIIIADLKQAGKK